MAGKSSNPLRLQDDTRAWDKERVFSLVLARLDQMPLTEALKAGWDDDDGNHWGLPCVSTFNEWLADRPEWAVARAHAQKARAEHLAEEALQLIDAEPRKKADGSVDPGAIRWAENRANQRKWMAAKLDRSTYGEQVQVDMQLHASIDIRGILAEARGRVIDAQAEQPPALPDDALDLFE
jgi:hypothetical protein